MKSSSRSSRSASPPTGTSSSTVRPARRWSEMSLPAAASTISYSVRLPSENATVVACSSPPSSRSATTTTRGARARMSPYSAFHLPAPMGIPDPRTVLLVADPERLAAVGLAVTQLLEELDAVLVDVTVGRLQLEPRLGVVGEQVGFRQPHRRHD